MFLRRALPQLRQLKPLSSTVLTNAATRGRLLSTYNVDVAGLTDEEIEVGCDAPTTKDKQAEYEDPCS